MNFNDGNVFLLTDFDDNMEAGLVLPLMKEIQKQREYKHGRIDLHINSWGGYGHLVDQLIELVEVAKRQDIVVRTIVPAIAFSAGSMLAITGTPGERYIAPNANHLIHYGRTGSSESTPLQIERFHAWKKEDFKNVIKHYNKYAKVPDIESHLSDEGFFVKARDCIRWGLADKYLDKFDIGYAE